MTLTEKTEQLDAETGRSYTTGRQWKSKFQAARAGTPYPREPPLKPRPRWTREERLQVKAQKLAAYRAGRANVPRPALLPLLGGA